jgi:hypothetical protein
VRIERAELCELAASGVLEAVPPSLPDAGDTAASLSLVLGLELPHPMPPRAESAKSAAATRGADKKET